VAVRRRNGEDLGAMTVEEFSSLLANDVEKMGRIA
jgi:threonyl-tRNA synthetase